MLCLLLLLKHQVCDDLNVDCSNIHWLVTRTRKGYYLNNTKGTNTDTAGTNSGILEGFKKPLGHWSDQTSYIYRWWSSYIPPFPLYTAVSPIMSFQFVTGCYFPDKNKYYWKGGGWVVVVGVISYFYWTINLNIPGQSDFLSTIGALRGKILLILQIFARKYPLLYQA